MIKNIRTFYSNINYIEKSLFIIIAFFPISLILGNFFINLTFLLIAVIFIIDLSLNKNFSFLKDITFWLLIIFFLSLLVNIFFSIDSAQSLPRVLKVLIMIPFIIQMKKLTNKYSIEFEKIIFSFWSVIFFVVTLDVLFEIIFGFNSIGFSTSLDGRIASFFGEELIVGSFFYIFSLFFISYFLKFYNNYKKIALIIIFIFIFISFLIGERANFIKFFITILFIYLFILEIKFKKKIFGITLLFIVMSLFINLNEEAKYRYYLQIKPLYTKDGLNNFLKQSKYGAHYNAAFKIFKEYPVFGVGIKNYRFESSKEKYKNEDYSKTNLRWASHPHQIHFEFLSETGLFGYISFLIFIITSVYLSTKSYLKNKNLFQLTSIIYIVVFLIPFLPSGSFFSTYFSSLFWINYAIMMSYIKK